MRLQRPAERLGAQQQAEMACEEILEIKQGAEAPWAAGVSEAGLGVVGQAVAPAPAAVLAPPSLVGFVRIGVVQAWPPGTQRLT